MGKLVDDIATGKSVNSDDGIVGPGDVGIMKTSCVSYDTFDARESKRVLPEEQSLVACPVEAKTLIVSRMNTPDRVGACGFVADNWPNLFLPDRLWRVRLRNSVDPYLVYVLLTSDGSKKVLRGMASGTSGSMHNIPKESFLDMELALPTSLEEQSKIAKQFASLDKLITLHQRKCQYRGLYGYLSWEQRKLGEFSKKRTTKNADGALSETFTNSAEQGVISQLDYFDHDITNDANISGYYVVQPDDFVYNPRISATAPCGPINRSRLDRAGVISPLYTVFSVDASVDKTYLEHYFKTSRWHDFMFLEGNSGARSDRFSISDATFFEMPIWCPEISEQKAIAKQLETADHLITLHQ